jgi:transposase InsO family protein
MELVMSAIRAFRKGKSGVKQLLDGIIALSDNKNRVTIAGNGHRGGGWIWLYLRSPSCIRNRAKVAIEARVSIGCYFRFYNTRRPHSSLDRQTPDQAYFNGLPQIVAA